MRWFPVSVRVVLVLVFTCVSLPFINVVDVTPATYIREFIVGCALVFELHLIFAAISFWGRLLDQQIGFMASGLFNPASQEQEPLLGGVILVGATVIFFSLGMHLHWLQLVMSSFQWVPLGSAVEVIWFWQLAAGFGWLFIVAVSLFLPTMVGLWLFDVLSAMLSRTLPQMNVYFVAMPLKIMLGLLLLSVSMTNAGHYVKQLNDQALLAVRAAFSG